MTNQFFFMIKDQRVSLTVNLGWLEFGIINPKIIRYNVERVATL